MFAHDGHHLLFYSTAANTTGGSTGRGSTAQLWITDLTGGQAHCLSCGLAHDPSSSGEGEITPFPDGKRVFFGSFTQPGSSSYGVLTCRPSVADCRHASIAPIDFSRPRRPRSRRAGWKGRHRRISAAPTRPSSRPTASTSDSRTSGPTASRR